MKIRYYADLWSGMNFSQYPPTLMVNPGDKSPNSLRVAVDVEFPDWLLARATGVDHVLAETLVPTVVP